MCGNWMGGKSSRPSGRRPSSAGCSMHSTHSGWPAELAPGSQFFCAFAGLLERTEGFRVLLEVPGEVCQYFERGRAEVMFDALDVRPLRFRVETEQGEKS